MNINDELQEMLRSRNYEVSLHINGDHFICNFPRRTEYPPHDKYSIKYKAEKYPKYAYYHLMMADMIRRCKAIGYDPALISIYKNNKLISKNQFVQYIKLSKGDAVKHNQIGTFLAYIATIGMTPEVIEEAKKHDILDYVNLISFLTISREDTTYE